MKIFFCIIFFLFIGADRCLADSRASTAKEAARLYGEKNYEEALKKYIQLSLDFPDDPRIQYNLANTYYQLKKYPEAGKSFLSASLKTEDPAFKKKTNFNLGNAYYRQGKLEDAISAYEKVLDVKTPEVDPNDLEAKQNIEFVREEMKKRKKQEQERQEQERRKKEQKKEKQDQGEEQQKQKESQGEQSQGQKEKEADKGQEGKEGERQEKSQEKKEQKGTEQTQSQSGKEKPAQEEAQAGAEKSENNKAEREKSDLWLDSLKEDGSKILKDQIKGQFGKRSVPERDW